MKKSCALWVAFGIMIHAVGHRLSAQDAFTAPDYWPRSVMSASPQDVGLEVLSLCRTNLADRPGKEQWCQFERCVAEGAYRVSRELLGSTDIYVLDPGAMSGAVAACLPLYDLYEEKAEEYVEEYRRQQALYPPSVEKVRLVITPKTKTIPICSDVSFAVKLAFTTHHQKPHPVTRDQEYSAMGFVRFESSDPAGLPTLGPGGSPPAISEGGVVSYEIHDPNRFRGLRPGRYTVKARIPEKPDKELSDFVRRIHFYLKDDLMKALSGLSTEATIIVSEPTIKEIKLVPETAEVLSGLNYYFRDVIVTFKESCVPPLHYNDVRDELVWSAQKGTMNVSVYTIDHAVPSALEVIEIGHAEAGKLPLCDTARLKAMMRYKTGSDTVTVTYRGHSATAKLNIAAPDDPVDVTSAVSWSPEGPTVKLTKPDQQTFTARHQGSKLSGSVTLQVAGPTLSGLKITPSTATLDVGSTTRFNVIPTYAEDCIEPEPLTEIDGLVWSKGTRGTVARDGSYSAASPGNDTVTVSYGGFSASATVQVKTPTLVIDPSRETILLKADQGFKASRSFTATLKGFQQVTHSPNTTWTPGQEFTADRCGTFTVSATYTDPVTGDSRTASAEVTVKADCIEVRRRLSDARDPAADPSHVKESRNWLQARLALLKRLGCDCGVELPPEVPAVVGGSGQEDSGLFDFSDAGPTTGETIGSGAGTIGVGAAPPDSPSLEPDPAPGVGDESFSEAFDFSDGGAAVAAPSALDQLAAGGEGQVERTAAPPVDLLGAGEIPSDSGSLFSSDYQPATPPMPAAPTGPSHQEIAQLLAGIDCSFLSGGVPAYDMSTGTLGCTCPAGTELSASGNACINCDQALGWFMSAVETEQLARAEQTVNEAGRCWWAPEAWAELEEIRCMQLEIGVLRSLDQHGWAAAQAAMGGARSRGCDVSPETRSLVASAADAGRREWQQRQQQQAARDSQMFVDMMGALTQSIMGMQNRGTGSSHGFAPNDLSSFFPTQPGGGGQSGAGRPPVQSGPPGGGGSSGLSPEQCKEKLCPECANAIGLLTAGTTEACDACLKRRAAEYQKCLSGSSGSRSSDTSGTPWESSFSSGSGAWAFPDWQMPTTEGGGKCYVGVTFTTPTRFAIGCDGGAGTGQYQLMAGGHPRIVFGPASFTDCQRFIAQQTGGRR